MKELLLDRIKQEGLRAYLFSVSGHFDAMSLPSLAEKFEMEIGKWRAAHLLLGRR
jgi:hypothetical protein